MDFRILQKILSEERLKPYLVKHSNNRKKAIQHYKSNIKISEAFYSPIAILEVGLRNNIDYQLQKKYSIKEWFDHPGFIKIISSFQLERIQEARTNILREKKSVTSGKIIAELSFGFWTSLFDQRFERTLWKELRFAFPRCPKNIRQRRTMSKKLNGIRKLRNRIFHHEPISWNFNALQNYRNEIYEGMDWLNSDLTTFFSDIFSLDKTLRKERANIT